MKIVENKIVVVVETNEMCSELSEMARTLIKKTQY
jgi:hypothetical protein